MKRILGGIILSLAFSAAAFASNETIDELIARLEGSSPETATREENEKKSFEEAFAEARKEIEAVKKHLRFQTDKIENITWVNTKINPVSPYFDIYCGEKQGLIWLRLIIRPGINTEPMEIRRVVVNADGVAQAFAVPPANRDITSEISSSRGIGDVRIQRWYRETVDMMVDQEIEKLLRRAADGGVTLIRLSGRYNVDFKMSKTARTAFDAMLRYYKARQVLLYGYVVGGPN